MKKIFLLIALAISTSAIYAQASVESIIIEKKNRNAVKLYIDQSEDITATALDARLKRSGLDGKRKKGITIYREVILSEISPLKLDIYTQVEKRGVGSVVYMAASKGYDNFTTPEDETITQNIITFLNSFVSDANYRSVDVNLLSKQEAIDKEEKAYLKLLDDQKDTEKKRSEAEVKLVQLQNDILAKQTEIEKLKSELDDLKNKRTNFNQQ
jgi:hypothetical protein